MQKAPFAFIFYIGFLIAPCNDEQPAKNIPKEKKLYKKLQKDRILHSYFGKALYASNTVKERTRQIESAKRYMLAKFMLSQNKV